MSIEAQGRLKAFKLNIICRLSSLRASFSRAPLPPSSLFTMSQLIMNTQQYSHLHIKTPCPSPAFKQSQITIAPQFLSLN